MALTQTTKEPAFITHEYVDSDYSLRGPNSCFSQHRDTSQVHKSNSMRMKNKKIELKNMPDSSDSSDSDKREAIKVNNRLIVTSKAEKVQQERITIMMKELQEQREETKQLHDKMASMEQWVQQFETKKKNAQKKKESMIKKIQKEQREVRVQEDVMAGLQHQMDDLYIEDDMDHMKKEMQKLKQCKAKLEQKTAKLEKQVEELGQNQAAYDARTKTMTDELGVVKQQNTTILGFLKDLKERDEKPMALAKRFVKSFFFGKK